MASRLLSRKLSSLALRLPGNKSFLSPATDDGKSISGNLIRTMATNAAREPAGGIGEESQKEIVDASGKETSAARRGRGRDFVSPIAPFGVFDLWDPFTTTSRSLRQMMDIMDRFVDDAFTSPSSNLLERTIRSGMRTPWDVVEKENAFVLRVDMPGISKEEVKVAVEDGELVIQGEHKADKTEDEFQGKNHTVYNTRMSLPKDVKQDEIKAELKDGVLYVVVPKAQESKKKVEVQVS